tara:strand:- start:1833 stop:3290 length:1458 start_codon:yes stop_codon:yes gene_type:complete
MEKIKDSKTTIILSFLFCIIFGVTVRVYNLNFDNLWFDEIVSFWVADPMISIKESYHRNFLTEGHPFFFNFLLKMLHQIFGYDPSIGRYFSSTIGILSIFSVTYLSKILNKNKAYLLTLFLVSTNIFLISYSQEVRVFMMMFFLVSINLIFFFKLIDTHETKTGINKITIFFILSNILMVLSNPLTLIIFFSIVLFVVINYFKFGQSYKNLNFSLGVTLIFIIIYIPYYFLNIQPYDEWGIWIKHPDLKFYTNFYFSKFFGSRLIGLIHLVLLISLIFIFRKKFIHSFNKKTLLIIMLFLSYFLPITFGYLYYPLIYPRYIIFVIIPIIIIISHLIFEIKNKYIKKFLIFLLIFFTLGNHFTESTLKQFFNDRLPYKPEFVSSLDFIHNSDYKQFTFDMQFAGKGKIVFYKTLTNYSKIIINKNKFNIFYEKKFELDKITTDHIWVICLPTISPTKCSSLKSIKSFVILQNKSFGSINLKLIRVI